MFIRPVFVSSSQVAKKLAYKIHNNGPHGDDYSDYRERSLGYCGAGDFVRRVQLMLRAEAVRLSRPVTPLARRADI